MRARRGRRCRCRHCRAACSSRSTRSSPFPERAHRPAAPMTHLSTLTSEPPFRLTAYARCAGCAAKLGHNDLSLALHGLPMRADPRLLVGRETYDDAAVYMLSEDIALVQT